MPPPPSGRQTTTDAVVDHPDSDARRSRAARRSRSRRAASPSQARSAAPSAAGSPGGTSSPGRIPAGGVTQGLRHTPDLGRDHRQAVGERLRHDHAVRLGSRCQHQQVRGAVAAGKVGFAQRSRKAHAIGQVAVKDAAAEPLANAGSRSRRPAHRHCQGRSEHRRERAEQHVVALAVDHGRDAEQRPARPRSRARGRRHRLQARRRARARRAARTARAALRRAHRLVVTTEAAAESTAPSRVRASSSAGSWPSGMCTSVTSRKRLAWGTSTSGAVEATSPSSSTTASSGIPRMTPSRAAYDVASGRGQEPGTACSRTDQPAPASLRQTWRS